MTSYLCYICLWRINLQSALSAGRRKTRMSFACRGYQFLWPYHSLWRSIFCSPLSGLGAHRRQTVSQCVQFCGSGGFAVGPFSSAIVLKSSKLSTLPIWSWCFRGTEWSHKGDSEIFVCTHNHVFRLKAMVRQSQCTGSCWNVPSPWEIVFAECKGAVGWAQIQERYGAGWLSYLPSLLVLNVASKLFVNIVTRMNSRSPV